MIWTEPAKAAAVIEAERWVGVPHRDRMCIHPVGIDCIHLMREILVAAGIVDRREIGFYRSSVGMFSRSNLMKDRIMTCLHARQIEEAEEIEFGDIFIQRTGTTSGHCGFIAGRKLFHSLANQTVMKSEWQLWRHRKECCLRLTAAGWKSDPSRRFP